MNNVKWDKSCLECQAQHGGTCESEYCARLKYDLWGDPYPPYVYGYDYDERERYIAQKQKRLEMRNE